MIRLFVLASILVATPALSASHHRAEPIVHPPSAGFAVRDVYWKCTPAGCSGGTSASRPAIVCAALAKHLGRLRSFSADGTALDSAALERCNAKAR